MGEAGQVAGMGNEKNIRNSAWVILRRNIAKRTRLSQISCYFDINTN